MIDVSSPNIIVIILVKYSLDELAVEGDRIVLDREVPLGQTELCKSKHKI